MRRFLNLSEHTKRKGLKIELIKWNEEKKSTFKK